MRRRLIVVVLAALVFAVGGLVLASGGRDDAGTLAPAEVPGLETRTVTAGEVDIEIQPIQLDDQGAVFVIILDTHSVELSADLTRASLEVDGVAWPVEAWSGDGPGGHHREGELRFASAGSPTGTVRLVLPDFLEPVDVTWETAG